MEIIDDPDFPENHKSGFVALVGRPNVGKSTLMNAFLQQKIAIVTPRPQTTRTRQLGIITEPTYQMIFVDTPGIIQNARHKLDEFMIETAVDTLNDADVILWLIDSAVRPGPMDQAIAKMLAETSDDASVVIGMNKSDQLTPDKVIPHTEAYQRLVPDAQWLLFSAQEGHGVPELLQMLADALPDGPRFYPEDQITDIFVRDIAAELIREQVFLQLTDELPYSIAVKVLEFKERPNGTTYISANIFVERDNHKKILIGKKGSRLRQLGAAARKEIEKLVDGKVFLELWVKVEPKWRRRENVLKRFGYSDPDA
ncbi:MAG: GTPase Era [Chloroflexota bacterium]